MPTISINWNYKTYRATVTPSTLLIDVLKDSCKYFQLDGDSSIYKLVNKDGKNMDLTLPFRFSNLAQGANLDILEIPLDERNNNNNINKNDKSNQNDQLVKIRISISSNDVNKTIMEEYPNNITLNHILQTIKDKCGLSDITNDRFSIQIMMKIIEMENFNKPISNLGLIEGNHAMRIRIKPNKQQEQEQQQQQPIVYHKKFVEKEINQVKLNHTTPVSNQIKDSKQKMEPEKPNELPTNINKSEEDEIKELIPPINSNIDISYINDQSNIKEHDEFSYEMNIDQAKIYQKMLSKRAADQPMLTKALRDKREAEERERKEQIKRSIYKGECAIRIKFPDNKVIQIKMDNRKTLNDLVNVLINEVLKPEVIPSRFNRDNKDNDLFFELYIALPHKKILGKGFKLDKKIDDCDFGNRISLLFKYEPEYTRTLHNGYILDHLLEKTETQNNNINNNVANTSESSISNSLLPNDSSTSGNKRAKFKQIPTWMKLSKK